MPCVHQAENLVHKLVLQLRAAVSTDYGWHAEDTKCWIIARAHSTASNVRVGYSITHLVNVQMTTSMCLKPYSLSGRGPIESRAKRCIDIDDESVVGVTPMGMARSSDF